MEEENNRKRKVMGATVALITTAELGLPVTNLLNFT